MREFIHSHINSGRKNYRRSKNAKMEPDYFVERDALAAEASDYEFDAPQFYDFTRTELDSEIEEAERWFEVSRDYPPFIGNVNMEKLMSVEMGSNSSKENCESISSNSPCRLSGAKDKAKGKSYITLHEAAEVKTSSDDRLLRSLSFMKPTKSSLAKQKANQNNPGHIFTRSKVSNAASASENKKQKLSNFKARPLNKKILEPRFPFQPKKSPPPLPDFHVFHLRTMERANHHASAKEKLVYVEIGSSSSKEKGSNTMSIGSSSVNDKGESYTTSQASATAKTSSDDKSHQSKSSSFMKPTTSSLKKQKVNHNHSGHIFTRSKVSNASSESESQKQKMSNFKARPLNKKILEPRFPFQPKKSPPPLPDLKTMERANHHASAKESGSSTSGKFLESPPIEQFSKRCNPKPRRCGDQMRLLEAKCLSDRSMYRSLDIC